MLKGITINYHGEPVFLYLRVITDAKIEIISAWFAESGQSLPDEHRMAIAVFRVREIVDTLKSERGLL